MSTDEVSKYAKINSTTNYVITIINQRMVKKLQVIFKGGELLFVMCL